MGFELEDCKLEVIERGFPELKNLEIYIGYKNMPDAYFGYIRKSRKKYIIDVDTSLKRVKRNIFLGGISHEIAHISIEHSMNVFCNFFDNILYNILYKNIKSYETWDERRTDLLVVERGLGQELLEFLKYADKRREEYTTEDGLTVKELEALIKQ